MKSCHPMKNEKKTWITGDIIIAKGTYKRVSFFDICNTSGGSTNVSKAGSP